MKYEKGGGQQKAQTTQVPAKSPNRKGCLQAKEETEKKKSNGELTNRFYNFTNIENENITFQTKPRNEIDKLPCIEIDGYREKLLEYGSDSESISDSDTEEDLVAKGPDKTSKSLKQPRIQSNPYPEVILSSIHYSGGTLLVGPNSDNECQVQQSNQESSQETDLFELIEKFTNELSYEERDILERTVQMAEINLIVENCDAVETTVAANKKDDSCDKDSGYGSPNSSHMSLSPFTPLQSSSEIEGSPLHDSQPPYFSPLEYDIIQHKNRASPVNQPLNIPVPEIIYNNGGNQIPVKSSKLLIITPAQARHQRPSIAPESVIVHEEGMKKSAEDRIKANLNKSHLFIEWIKVCKNENFFEISGEHQDTIIMKHLKNGIVSEFFYEILHCQLSRVHKTGLKSGEREKCLAFLKYKNQLGESALTIAICKYRDTPIIARYIIEVLVQLGDDVDQANHHGNTLLHHLTEKGDNFVHIIAEFLNAKRPRNEKSRDDKAMKELCFDVNKKNHLLETPLHLASKLHNQRLGHETLSTIAISKLLIKHNANVLMQDSNGMTPIHLVVKNSASPQLVRAFLSSSNLLYNKYFDVKDFSGDTALHYAAARNDLPLTMQAMIMKQLKDSNWSLNTKNHHERTPISLLADDRKKFILESINTK